MERFLKQIPKNSLFSITKYKIEIAICKVTVEFNFNTKSFSKIPFRHTNIAGFQIYNEPEFSYSTFERLLTGSHKITFLSDELKEIMHNVKC